MKHKRMASVCLALWLLLLLLPGCSIGGPGIDGVGGTPQSTPPSSQSEQADKTPGGEDKKTGGEDRTGPPTNPLPMKQAPLPAAPANRIST